MYLDKLVMNMQFYVFPDYSTFEQRVPLGRKEHYEIIDIKITSNGAFWFTTTKKGTRKFVNANSAFVHLHDNTKSIDQIQFDEKPYKVTRDNFKYDPKKKQLIIGDSWWKQPVWTKTILGCYNGSEIPAKKMKIKGDWILDRHERIIYLILDYAPIIRKNKISDEPPTKEQLDYAKKLEEQIADLETY